MGRDCPDTRIVLCDDASCRVTMQSTLYVAVITIILGVHLHRFRFGFYIGSPSLDCQGTATKNPAVVSQIVCLCSLSCLLMP